MTKHWSALLLAVAASTGVSAQQLPSPLLGRWEADTARLPIAPDQKPRRVTMTFTDEGNGTWRTNVDIVAPDGAEIHGAGSYKLDGTPAASTGYPGIDTVAITRPAPNVMVGTFYKDGMPRTTRTYVVSADGKSMSETRDLHQPE